MNWLKGQKENFKIIEHIGDKYCINLSPKDEIDNENNTNIVYLSKILDKNPSTFELKYILINLQQEYDKSDEVNSFTINGIKGWLDSATRLALNNSCDILIEEEINEYELWIGNNNIIISPITLKEFLKEVELYAMNCYKVTAEHISEISSINSRYELFNYDISKDYPKKINYNIY